MFFVPIIPPENGKPAKKSLAVVIVVTGTLLAVGAILCLSFFFVDELPVSMFSLILIVLVAFGMIVVLALSVVSEDKSEGVLFKNSIGTYLHGPILARNPHLVDYLIAKGLRVRTLEKVDDFLTHAAHTASLKLK